MVGDKISDEKISEYYSENYFYSDNDKFAYKDYDELEGLKAVTFQDRLQDLDQYVTRGKKLLDVGCATGLFVREACQSGWDAYGVDISRYAVELANKKTNGRCYHASAETWPFEEESFDVITALDCIEHVQDPIKFLKVCLKFLKDEGIILLETPNVDGVMAAVMRRRWPYYRPPEHLVYFGKGSIKIALERVGCKLIYVKPSYKTVNLNYVAEQLYLTTPLLGEVLRSVGRISNSFNHRPFNFPTGSFYVLAQKGKSTNSV